MSKVLRISILMLALLALPTALSAGIWDNMNYQGILVDSDGKKINGDKSITFSLWDTEVDGDTFWVEQHNQVPVVDGVVNVVLGSKRPLSTLSGLDQYWLQIQIDTDEPMERIKLTAVPYAFATRNADKLDGFTSGSDAQQIPVNNGTLNENLNADKVDGFDAGNEASQVPISNGELNVNLNADKLDDLHAEDFSLADHTHTGYAATSHTHSPDQITDLDSLISGLVSDNDSGHIDIGTSFTTIESDTINVPANGYCLVIATADFEMTSSDDSATLVVALTDTEGTIAGTADYVWKLPAAELGEVHAAVISVHGVFSVTAADVNEFFLQAKRGELNTTATALNWTLSVIYFPLTYEP